MDDFSSSLWTTGTAPGTMHQLHTWQCSTHPAPLMISEMYLVSVVAMLIMATKMLRWRIVCTCRRKKRWVLKDLKGNLRIPMSIDTDTSDALSAILGEYSRSTCYGNVLFGGDLLELFAATTWSCSGLYPMFSHWALGSCLYQGRCQHQHIATRAGLVDQIIGAPAVIDGVAPLGGPQQLGFSLPDRFPAKWINPQLGNWGPRPMVYPVVSNWSIGIDIQDAIDDIVSASPCFNYQWPQNISIFKERNQIPWENGSPPMGQTCKVYPPFALKCIRSTVAVLQLCNGHRPEAEGSRVATTRNIWVLCRVFPVVCQISCAVVLQITSKWNENVEPLDPYHNFEPTSGRRPWDCFFEVKADKTNECEIDFVVATAHNIQFTPQDVLFHLIFMMILTSYYMLFPLYKA